MNNPATLYLCIATACMPSSCPGRYARIGIVLSNDGSIPKQIKDTNNHTVIETWEKQHRGGDKSAAALSWEEAEKRIQELSKMINVNWAHRDMPTFMDYHCHRPRRNYY